MQPPGPTAARVVGGRPVADVFGLLVVLLLVVLLLSAASAKAQGLVDLGLIEEFEIAGDCVPQPSLDPQGCPNTVVAGPDGALWFVEFWGSRVGRMTPDGTVTDMYPTPTPHAEPEQIIVGPDGKLWFSEYGANQIGRVDPGTGDIVEFEVPSDPGGPVGIAGGPDGNVWFVERNSNKVGRIDLATIDTSGVPATADIDEFAIPTPSSQPFGIVAGPDDAMWFTEELGDNIGRIAVTAQPGDPDPIEEVPIPSGSEFWDVVATGITRAKDGNLWFVESDGAQGDRIGRLNPLTREIVEFPFPNRVAENYGAFWVATGLDGNIWFTGTANDTIGRVTPSGDIDVRTVTTGSEPYGIAPGFDCDIWFTQSNTNSLARLETGCYEPPVEPPVDDGDDDPPPGGPEVPPKVEQAPEPKLNRLSMTRRRFAPKGRSRFVFHLSVDAKVSIVVERRGVGRRQGRRCLAATRARRNRPRCTRHTLVSRISHDGRAGRNATAFKAVARRKGKLRPLPAGAYRASLSATAGKRRSPVRSISFRIVRR